MHFITARMLLDIGTTLLKSFRIASQSVCPYPSLPAGDPRDAAAPMGSDHQRPEYRCQGPTGGRRPHPGVTRHGYGPDQGAGQRICPGQYPGQCPADGLDRDRSGGQPLQARTARHPFEDYSANVGKGIPIGRMGTAQEYANLACFLASEAGSYVTGTAINLDGGACPVV